MTSNKQRLFDQKGTASPNPERLRTGAAGRRDCSSALANAKWPHKLWQRPLILIAVLTPLLDAYGAEVGASILERANEVLAQRSGYSWRAAPVGLNLGLGDRVRTGANSRALLAVTGTDRTRVRLDERTVAEIERASINLSKGGIYYFSREQGPELEIKTPAANGLGRGTQVIIRVTADGKTLLSVREGKMDFFNQFGRVTVNAGDRSEAEIGKAPTKPVKIEAKNLLQWALYYPGVVDPHDLGLRPAEESAVATSLAAYREGDLLGALEKYPKAYRPSSPAARLYWAAVVLAVGRVDEAQRMLAGGPRNAPGRMAIEEMIDAVNFVKRPDAAEPTTASGWLAHSYYVQSRTDDGSTDRIERALIAAQQAVKLAPDFGFASVRVAELEFSRGYTQAALRELNRIPRLSERNAQAHALRGFLLSAQNRIDAARDEFQIAIDLDASLSNAWLGRGLCAIRQHRDAEGRQDLQTAATLEPNRSLLHSYLGKAFSQIGDNASANKDLERAKELDPNDPTPWLYSAIQRKQENRYNEAIRDLEKSIKLNDNRRLYRSNFLLDQDLAVRGTNLAAIYQNNGMVEQSVREAVRAVDSNYSSAPAHLFLANSYNALRDPTRILLRYETAWFNELLLSNLLSPVGGGPLSQFVSEQEYSKMFEHDGFGINSVTEYFSTGELRETASQYGTFGNLSYALDAEYQYNDGLRPNNRISRLESYAQFKLQLGPQDTVFFQTKFENLESGEIFQHYDNREVDRSIPALTYDFHERQEPALLLLGLNHEWSPGNHTLLLLGRLANDQTLTALDTPQTRINRDVLAFLPQGAADSLNDLRHLTGRGPVTKISSRSFDFDYHANFETYNAELQQIITLGNNADTLILGGRYQSGQFDSNVRLTGFVGRFEKDLFDDPPADQAFDIDFERINLYAYDTWRVARWLSLTAGVTYDNLRYPDNFRSPPINNRQTSLEKVSPKFGFILQPLPGMALRGAYSEAISGSSFDESVRLEPTQIAGFTQAFRTLAPESLIGSVAGSEYKLWGVSLEQKVPSTKLFGIECRTFLGAEFAVLEQDIDRTIGVFDALETNQIKGILPSSLSEQDRYREDVFVLTLNELVGERWSFGARYRATSSHFRSERPDLQDALATAKVENLPGLAKSAENDLRSALHELSLYILYNHPSGFFARADANWFNQENDGYEPQDRKITPYDERRPGDDFWQFNLFAGWRFHRNQCELGCGLLNITGTDYQLNPLNPYNELPRERTLIVRVKFSF